MFKNRRNTFLTIIIITIFLIFMLKLKYLYISMEGVEHTVTLHKVDNTDKIIVNRLRKCKTAIPYSYEFLECFYRIKVMKDSLTDDKYKKEIVKLNTKVKMDNSKSTQNLKGLKKDDFEYLLSQMILYSDNDVLYIFDRKKVDVFDMYLVEIWKKENNEWYFKDYNPLMWKKRILRCKEDRSIILKCNVDKNGWLIFCNSKSCKTKSILAYEMLWKIGVRP